MCCSRCCCRKVRTGSFPGGWVACHSIGQADRPSDNYITVQYMLKEVCERFSWIYLEKPELCQDCGKRWQEGHLNALEIWDTRVESKHRDEREVEAGWGITGPKAQGPAYGEPNGFPGLCGYHSGSAGTSEQCLSLWTKETMRVFSRRAEWFNLCLQETRVHYIGNGWLHIWLFSWTPSWEFIQYDKSSK